MVETMIHFSKPYLSWISLGLCWILAIALLGGQAGLKNQLEELKKEYVINLDLSHHKEEHLRVYQGVFRRGKLPPAKPLPPNEWIHLTQTMVGEEKLFLQELKPVQESNKAGEGKGGLFLVLEGRMNDLLNFFYRIAAANDLIYIRQLLILPVDEGSDSVRAQMTLSQF